MTFALDSPTVSHPVPGSEGPLPWTLPELRLVCLDIDDTLLDFSAASRRSLHTLLGRTDMWPLWEYITEEYVAGVVNGQTDYPDMHARRTQAFLTELGVATDKTDVAEFEARRKDLLRRSWRLFDDVLPCLEWLTATGIRLAAVTNASGAHQREKLTNLGLEHFFDHIAIAGEVGVAKPDPAMFHSVCAVLDCEPAQALHIGDKLCIDALGAHEAGLHGVWLNRVDHDGDQVDLTGVQRDREQELPPGVHMLAGLDELPQLLVSEFTMIGVPAPR